MRFRFGILGALLTQPVLFIYASTLDPIEASRLSARLRTYVDQDRRNPKFETMLKAEFTSGLALSAHLLSFVAVEPAARSSAMRTRHEFLIGWARASAVKSMGEAAPSMRRQIRARVWTLLKRYTARGDVQRNLYLTLDTLGLWRPEDLPVLARLAGYPDQYAAEYAMAAYKLLQSYPERAADVTAALRRFRRLSDDQLALLVLAEGATAKDVHALLWSRINLYARWPKMYDLRVYDESDLIHMALEHLVEAYVADDEAVDQGFQRTFAQTEADLGISTDIRQRRADVLHQLAQAQLLQRQLTSSVRVNAPPPATPSSRPAVRIRHEDNIIHLEFGDCTEDLVPAD